MGLSRIVILIEIEEVSERQKTIILLFPEKYPPPILLNQAKTSFPTSSKPTHHLLGGACMWIYWLFSEQFCWSEYVNKNIIYFKNVHPVASNVNDSFFRS